MIKKELKRFSFLKEELITDCNNITYFYGSSYTITSPLASSTHFNQSGRSTGINSSGYVTSSSSTTSFISPGFGAVYYNMTERRFEYWNGVNWQSLDNTNIV